MISLLAPNANGDRAKNTIATRDKLISNSFSSAGRSKRPALSL
jgi:hypothetical protein